MIVIIFNISPWRIFTCVIKQVGGIITIVVFNGLLYCKSFARIIREIKSIKGCVWIVLLVHTNKHDYNDQLT